MATLVSLNDALYSLAYWYNVAHKSADGLTADHDRDAWATATATNLLANVDLATVTGYTAIKGADL